MAKRINTSQVLKLKTKDQTASEAITGGGSLVARRLSNATCWRFQYKHDGKLKRFTFGQFDERGDTTGKPDAATYTLDGARERVKALATLQAEVGDLSEHMAEQQRQAQAQREAAQRHREAEANQARNCSLAKLCQAYWQNLEADGKASARDVRNGLRLWVIEKQPALAAKKASEVTTEDVLTILRAIIDAGKTTQTNRVRSYLSAAYTFGLGSTTDPLASSRASGFRLTNNPVAPVKRVAKFETAGERVLSADELGELLRILEAKATPAAKAVTLSLRLGGQRITQLLAATAHDYDRDNQRLTLKDNKGRRTQARQHVLPVVSAVEPLLAEALTNPHPKRQGLYSGLTMETVSKLIVSISKEQETNGAQPYSWKDLRRTCETMLAAMGISKDLRAQIQSHGLSGVQERHYDKHQYIDEKHNALEAWNARLDELKTGAAAASNVVQLTR